MEEQEEDQEQEEQGEEAVERWSHLNEPRVELSSLRDELQHESRATVSSTAVSHPASGAYLTSTCHGCSILPFTIRHSVWNTKMSSCFS